MPAHAGCSALVLVHTAAWLSPSRLAVALRALPDKATITLLRALLDALERHGKPRAIRTDNEAVFASRLFSFALALLGIRHQRTERHCPWQNGRVERFFGTLKEQLDGWAVDSFGQLELALKDFRTWYPRASPSASARADTSRRVTADRSLASAASHLHVTCPPT